MKTDYEIIAELLGQLNQIADMAIGDGLDYSRSLTDPTTMSGREVESQAAVIRGCFMGIHHKAKETIRQALRDKAKQLEDTI